MITIQSVESRDWEHDLELYFHSVFMSCTWLDTVKTNNHTPIFFDLFEGELKVGKISGLLINNRYLKGQELYFYSGPALKTLTESTYIQCYDSIYLYAKQNKINRVVIGSYDNKHSLKCSSNNYYLSERVEYIIPIKEGRDNIKFGSRFKRNVKTAKKQQPNIVCGNNTHFLNSLNKLIEDTHAERKKKFATDYDHFYLKNLNYNSLGKITNSKNAQFFASEINEDINCSELILESGTSRYMLLKGCNSTGYKYGMSSFLCNELINRFEKDNVAHYNLGGRPPTRDGDGLAAFKISSGAQEVKCYGGSTNYLVWPYTLLNPLINIGRKLPKENTLVKLIKKML